jgi:adenylate cyclase, class 2
MNEIEVKILNINPNSIRKDLKKYHAKFVKKVFQQNILYANAYTKKSKIVVRVRREKENNYTLLTIKANRRFVQGHKLADEYETFVDYSNIVSILETLGFKRSGIGEVKREYWKLKGCSVEICILPKIPPFIEIEGSAKNILFVAKLLGYTEKDYYPNTIFHRYKIKTKYLRF